MRIGVVLDPVACRGRGQGFWRAVAMALENSGSRLEIFETDPNNDAEHLARQAAGGEFDLVIAVGGDGTIARVAAGILQSHNPHTSFSFVAMGAGSDFARNFVLPKDPAAYAGLLLSAPARPMDAGVVTCEGEDGRALTRHFINIASFGVSGRIARAVNGGGRRRVLSGKPLFLFHSVAQLLRYRPGSVGLRLDGIDLYQGPVTAVAVSNGCWFGAGMRVAPAASLTDGLFDVVVIRGAPATSVLKLMNGIYSGAHVDHPLVSIHRARRVEAWPTRQDRATAARIESDGQTPGRVPARFDNLAGAIMLKI